MRSPARVSNLPMHICNPIRITLCLLESVVASAQSSICNFLNPIPPSAHTDEEMKEAKPAAAKRKADSSDDEEEDEEEEEEKPVGVDCVLFVCVCVEGGGGRWLHECSFAFFLFCFYCFY